MTSLSIFLEQFPQCNCMEVTCRVESDDRTYIDVAREVSINGEKVKMVLEFRSNMWGGYKEYEFLQENDFYVFSVNNGTAKQQSNYLNKGTGNFTKLVCDVIASGSLYVRGPSLYWYKTFDIVKRWDTADMIEVKMRLPCVMRFPCVKV